MSDKMRILLVDRYDEFTLAVTLMLTSKEFDVQTTFSARQALHMCLVEDFDLLVVGSKLSEIDGAELLRKVRKLKPPQRVLHIKDLHSRDIEKKRVQRNGVQYVFKHFHLDRFFDRVSEALRSNKVGV